MSSQHGSGQDAEDTRCEGACQQYRARAICEILDAHFAATQCLGSPDVPSVIQHMRAHKHHAEVHDVIMIYVREQQ